MAVQEQRAPRERSAIREMHTGDRLEPETVVYVDCVLTRRKRHHMVCDTIDSVLFRSRWFSDIVEWLEAEQIHRYAIVTDRGRYIVTVSDDEPERNR